MARSTSTQDHEVWNWFLEQIDDRDVGNMAMDYLKSLEDDVTPLFDLLADICDPEDIFDEKLLIKLYGGEE